MNRHRALPNRDVWKIDFLVGLCIERTPEVEHETLRLVLQLDTVATDLARAAMNPRFHFQELSEKGTRDLTQRRPACSALPRFVR